MTTNQTKFGIIYKKIVMQAGDDEQMINYEWPKVIKIGDKVKIENCFFISKYTTNKLPSIFTNWVTFSSMSHIIYLNIQYHFVSKGNLQIPGVQARSYGKMLLSIWL